MKLLRSFILAGIIFWLHPVHAQSGPELIPLGEVPNSGTFWLVLPGSLIAPCPPVSAFNDSPYAVYYLSDGTYLVDNTAETGGLNSDELNTASDLVLAEIAEDIAGQEAEAAMASPMVRMTMLAGSLSSAYAYANPIYLTNMAVQFASGGSMAAAFSVAGGTNFVPYDILTATNFLTPLRSWSWIGIGYTSNRYEFSNQPAGMAFYVLARPSKTMVVGLGDDSVGQCDVPYGLTNVVQVAAGREHSLALKTDGTVAAWGDNTFGQGAVPTNLPGVTMISAGYYDDYALLTNGTVRAWGLEEPRLGYNLTNVPPGLTNVVVIAAGALHTLALRSNGTVVAWGYDSGSGETIVPPGITNVTAIAAGGTHSLAVSNGYVVPWGNDSFGQCDVPFGLSNVEDVAAGPFHSVALLQNGTVAAWGDDRFGQTDIPAGLSNVVAIAAGGDPFRYVAYSMALKSDGTTAVWGNDDPSAPIGGLNNVIGIAAGNFHGLALRTGPPTPVITQEPIEQYQITNGTVAFMARGAGLYGVTYQWQFNGVNISGATNGSLTVTNVQSSNASNYTVTVTDNGGMGSIVSSNVSVNFVVPPVILSQSPLPTNQTVVFGTNVTLSVTATAPGMNNGFPLSYQWQTNGMNIARANDASYRFTVTATTFGTYSVIVSNIVGSTNAAWQVRVVYPGGLLISQQPENQYQVAGGSVSFFCGAVSSNSVVLYQWQFDNTNILGATNATLTLTNVQAAQQGFYNVAVSDGANNLTSSNANFTLVTPPTINSETIPNDLFLLYQSAQTLNVSANAPGQTNGFPISYQWQFDGTNLTGQTSSNYTFNGINSGTYAVDVTNAAGSTNASWQVNVVYPGGIAGWGANLNGQLTISEQLTNGISIAAGEAHGIVALDSGAVTNWGSYWTGTNFTPVTATPPITNAIAVAAASRHDLALLQGGGIVAWGLNDFGQTNVPVNATNAIAIAAGGQQSLALLQNGTVLQWGQTNAPIPAGLTNVTAIAAGTNFCLALLSNSTVVAWGANNFGQTNVPSGLSNVVGIAAGGAHALALEQNGTVVAWGDNTYGETNVPVGLSNVMNITAGDNHSIALQNNGIVVAWGGDTSGQTNVTIGLNQVKFVAGGGTFTLAVQFSPTVMYPVNVSRDLLLIYNTNSPASSMVENYYIANRPMVGAANVLGINCTSNETILPSDFTNSFIPQIQSWLAVNPTIRPQYVILFNQMPSRVNTNDTPGFDSPIGLQPSVQYQIYSGACSSSWNPFVTSINMNGYGDVSNCIGYIDKLQYFATNYSPGKLLIGGSAGGYANTNFAFDDVRHGLGTGDNDYALDGYVISNAMPIVIAANTNLNVIFVDGVENGTNELPHLTNAVNVTGYISWGAHSSLDGEYATNGIVRWFGNSSWWLIKTLESFNGQWTPGQGNIVRWFEPNAFGGTNYSNTPIGAVSNTDEPNLEDWQTISKYFALWASGKNLPICAWNSTNTANFQVVGDPFITR